MEENLSYDELLAVARKIITTAVPDRTMMKYSYLQPKAFLRKFGLRCSVSQVPFTVAQLMLDNDYWDEVQCSFFVSRHRAYMEADLRGILLEDTSLKQLKTNLVGAVASGSVSLSDQMDELRQTGRVKIGQDNYTVSGHGFAKEGEALDLDMPELFTPVNLEEDFDAESTMNMVD